MATPSVGSLLIASSQVERLKDWYRRCFDAEETDMGAFVFGPCQVFIEEHSEVSGPVREPARIILNLDVDDCRAVEERLRANDVEWEREVEQMPFGLIGTVRDPDGNLVQIIEWGTEPEQGHGR